VAFEPGRGAFQDGLARARQFVLDVVEGIGRAARKALRQLGLVGAQHVDDVVRVAAEDGHAVGHGTEAPQDQRRRQRHGIEGTGREAAETAVGQARGNHRHAGGELRQCLAEMGGIEFLRWRAGRACVHGRPVYLLPLCQKSAMPAQSWPACPDVRVMARRFKRRCKPCRFALQWWKRQVFSAPRGAGWAGLKRFFAGEHHGWTDGRGGIGGRLFLV